MLKVGTDFSGIGSPEAALRRLNLPHKNVFACDIDKYAKQSFLELNNPNKFYDDITTRDYKDVPQLDLYVAGFPCQSFSMAGKRGGFDDVRGTLFFNVAEFIKVNQPKCFILENVKGLLSHDSGRTYQTITDVLTNCGGTLNGQIRIDNIGDGLGYHVYTKVLNTKDYGIPQNRERIFIVGFKDWKEFRFPKKMPLQLRLKDLLEKNVNEKYYLSDKMIKSFSNHKERHKEKGTGFQWQPKDRDDIANSITVELKQIGNIYDNEHNSLAGRVYDKNGLSITLKSEGGGLGAKSGLYKVKNKIRRLTPLETWRLQGFTDEEFYKVEKVNSDTQLYKQAGNSITVNVMTEILRKIYDKSE
jgi:DNA (cytosine-5)-methyltransferase 1